jgi:hypothetical protein
MERRKLSIPRATAVARLALFDAARGGGMAGGDVTPNPLRPPWVEPPMDPDNEIPRPSAPCGCPDSIYYRRGL